MPRQKKAKRKAVRRFERPIKKIATPLVPDIAFPKDEKEVDALLDSLGTVSVARGRMSWKPGAKAPLRLTKMLQESVKALNSLAATGEVELTDKGEVRAVKLPRKAGR